MIQHTRFAHTLGSVALGAALVLTSGSALAQEGALTGPAAKSSPVDAKAEKEKKEAILALGATAKGQKSKGAASVVTSSNPATKSKAPVPPAVKAPVATTKSKTPVAGPAVAPPVVPEKGTKSKASGAATKAPAVPTKSSAGATVPSSVAGGMKSGPAGVKSAAGAAKTPASGVDAQTVSSKAKSAPVAESPTVQVKSQLASSPMKAVTESQGLTKKGSFGSGLASKGASAGAKVPFKESASFKKPGQAKVALPKMLFVKHGSHQGAGRFPAAHSVPELDARGARTAVALLLGVALLLASRRRQPAAVA